MGLKDVFEAFKQESFWSATTLAIDARPGQGRVERTVGVAGVLAESSGWHGTRSVTP
ncbi:hypothetical protein GTY41_43445 [Streptomyces sp. SID685]|nr:hypothetical protein [Streptomyces sp. SID685]MYR91587.1 hypothetical protein [Streptomyces sp. SID685]